MASCGWSTYVDVDGDGFGDPSSEAVSACAAPDGYADNALDCDDTNAAVSPGADEVCGGIDDDCDGMVDDDDDSLDTNSLEVWFIDEDGDGYGDPDTPSMGCDEVPAGVLDGTDCDDTRASVNPGVPEVCNGVDDNCDTLVDDDDPALDTTTQRTWYLDDDGDGFGDAAVPTVACDAPADHRNNALDCDDGDPLFTVERGWVLDSDNDGFGAGMMTLQCTAPTAAHVPSSAGLDCNDAAAAVFPGQLEVCNGIDDDCDAQIDDDDPSTDLSTGLTWFADNDGDGFGNAAVIVRACAAGPGRTADDTDCSDNNPDVSPGQIEICNGFDDDCDGLADDADPAVDPTTLQVWYLDDDDDGFGDLQAAAAGCVAPANHVADATDCDDGDPAVVAPTLWVEDGDGDGIGAGGVSGPTCTGPDASWVGLFLGQDCDDGDDTVFPGAVDVCGDGFDQDCDGLDACGLYDDFEVLPLDPAIWVGFAGDGALTNAESASGSWSAELSGISSALTSVVFDTSSCTSVGWSYAGQRGPESPDFAEFLTLEWWDGSAWLIADALEGDSNNDATFSVRAGTIANPSALHANFQVRFRSNGSLANFDQFYLDDVAIECL